MARITDLSREHTWRQRHQRQRSSGLSIAAFCARERISVAAFYAWRQRLKGRSLSTLREPPLFVPVDVNSSPRQTDVVPSRAVEIELPHQVRVCLDTVPEPEWLGRVVAAVAGLPPREATS
jgi:hypothetical protein